MVSLLVLIQSNEVKYYKLKGDNPIPRVIHLPMKFTVKYCQPTILIPFKIWGTIKAINLILLWYDYHLLQ